MSPLNIETFDSIHQIEAQTWNRLTKGQPFSSHAWYAFGEEVLTDKPRHILLSQAGEIVGRASYWLSGQEPVPIAFSPLRRLLQAWMQRHPLLICRAPLANGVSGLILPDDGQGPAVLKALVDTARHIARRHQAGAIIFDYLSEREFQFAWPADFSRVDWMDPGTVLDINWPDFDGYLASLSKSVRKDFRRHGNRARDLGIKVRTSYQVDDIDTALELIRQVEVHHGSPPDPHLRAMLNHAHRVNAMWITAHMDDRLVGCGLLLRDGAAGRLTALGLDYSISYVYFQLVYKAIEVAIQSGLKILQGGTGAYPFKIKRGFHKTTNHHLVFSARSPILRWLARFAS